MGGGDDIQMQGVKRKSMLVIQRADMNTLRGSAQPKRSESLNQVFSHLQTTSSFFNTCFTSLLVVWNLHSLQSKSTNG